MRKFVASVICLVLIISVFGCSKAKKTVSNLKPVDKSADTKGDSASIDLFELSSTIFEDIETQFKDSSIILESLQKNKKGTLVEAKIAQADAESTVPQAVLLLSENFKRLQKINILVSEDETRYSINVDTLVSLSENNNNNDLLDAIWDEIKPNSKMSSTDEPVEDLPQASGV